MRSGGEWAIVSGYIMGSQWSCGHEWLSGIVCISLGVGMGELASEERGEEVGDLLGQWSGHTCSGFVWV